MTCATVLDNWRQKSNITYGNNTTFYIGRHFVTETCNIVCRLWVIYTFSALMVLNNSSFSDLFIVILHRIIPELGGQFWICVDILELSCENVLFILFFFGLVAIIHRISSSVSPTLASVTLLSSSGITTALWVYYKIHKSMWKQLIVL